MASSERWQRRVSAGLLALIGISLFIMAWDGVLSSGLTARGAWAVAMIALLAAVATFYLGSALQSWELKRHVLDITAHPGGMEALNQDLEKVSNILTEQRDALRQFPELRSRLERVEAWEPDLTKASQALAQSDKLNKLLTEMSIETTSRCAGLAGSLRELRDKLVELDPLRQRLAELDKLGADLPGLANRLSALGSLPEEVGKAAERSAALSAEVNAAKEGLSALGSLPEDLRKMAERFAEKTSSLAEEMAGLKNNLSAIKAQPAPGAAAGAGGEFDGLSAQVEELKKVVAQLQAEQPNLDINIKEAKLVSQQDRTVIVCSLTVRNLSNRPNEITAVRAELDSGRDRMAPTAVRHWLPDGKQTNEERLILLPQKVLENSTTAPITLTAIGWPLEKSQESYAFRITLRDKNGNEFVKNHRLVPEQSGT